MIRYDSKRPPFRTARSKTGAARMIAVVALLLIVTGTLGFFWYRGLARQENPVATAITSPVFVGPFQMTVVEAGDVESSSNVEIRCQVKSQGRAGAVILSVIPEGTVVKEGDFLCQLDDSIYQDQLVEQRIQVAKDRASRIQAESDLTTAEQILVEFQSGVYEQELASLESELAVANEMLRRARDTFNYSERLSRKGFLTQTQLEADGFAVSKAELDVELAKQKLDVYSRFTKKRTLLEYEAEIEKQRANVEAANFTLELSQNRVREIEEQIAFCRITAPRDGTLVYANEVDRRGDSSFVIEEGATLRDGQPIFYLPDPTKMQVRAAVNDSKINLVEVGQSVTLRLDSEPETPIVGEVVRVAPYPLPRRWFQAPIEYEVVVEIQEQKDSIRSGLRAKVEILARQMPDAIQLPVASIVQKEEGTFVMVKNGNGVDLRPIVVGPNNEAHAVVESGVDAGEEVLIDPERYIDLVEFPTAS